MVLCEPGKVARIAEIGNTLEQLQAAVKGDIEAFYPFEEEVCIVCNEEGKFNGCAPNRAVYGENKEMLDIIWTISANTTNWIPLSKEYRITIVEKILFPQ